VQLVAIGNFVISDFLDVSSNFAPVDIFESSVLVWSSLLVGLLTVVLSLFWSELFAVYKKRQADRKVKSDVAGGGGLLASLQAKSMANMLVYDDDDIDRDVDDQEIFDPSACFHDYLESLFPAVFSSKDTTTRFIDELTSNHLLLVAIFSNSRSKRLLTTYEIVSLGLQSCFIVASVTSLEMGTTDGECATLGEEGMCMANLSLQNPDVTACEWNTIDALCFANPDALVFDLQAFLLNVLVTVIVATPLRILHGLIFDVILHAPSSSETVLVNGSPEDDAGAEEVVAEENYDEEDASMSLSSRDAVRRKRLESMQKKSTKWSSFKSLDMVLGRPDALVQELRIPDEVLRLRERVFGVEPRHGLSPATKPLGLQRSSKISHSSIHSESPSTALERDDGTNDFSPNEVHARTFDTSALTAATLFSTLHAQMFAYVVECRKLGLSFSNDSHARRYGAPSNVVMKGSSAFARAWKLSIINAKTGSEFTSPQTRPNKSESVGVVWNDKASISDSLRIVHAESQKVAAKIEGYSAAAAGAEFCHHLIIDLLGRHTMRAKVFETKSSWHLKSDYIIPPVLKTVAFCFSVLLNVYFMWMCMLYGGAKGRGWQVSWFFFSVLFLFFMFAVEMTVEAVMVGFVIPCQVLMDIRALMAEFQMRLNTREVYQLLLDHHNGTTLSGIDGMNTGKRGDDDENDGHDRKSILDTFSSTDHLFVSAFIAREFPSLPESVLVRVFRHVHPRMGLLKESALPNSVNGTRKGLLNFMTGLLAGSLSFFSVLMWIGTQPMVVQKLLVSAPLPVICSVLTSIVYVADKDSLIIIAGAVALGLAAIVTLTYYTLQGVRLTLAKSKCNDEEQRKSSKDSKHKSVADGGYKISISAFGVAPGQVLPESRAAVSSQRASIINPSFDEDHEVLHSIKQKATLEADIRRVSMVNRRDRQRSALQKRLAAISESKPELKSIVEGVITKKRERDATLVKLVQQAANELLRARLAEEARLRVEEARRKNRIEKRLQNRLYSKAMHRHGASSSSSSSEELDDGSGDDGAGNDSGFTKFSGDDASSENDESEPEPYTNTVRGVVDEDDTVNVSRGRVQHASDQQVARVISLGGAHQWKGVDRHATLERRRSRLADAVTSAAASSESSSSSGSDTGEPDGDSALQAVVVRTVHAVKRAIVHRPPAIVADVHSRAVHETGVTGTGNSTSVVQFHSVKKNKKDKVKFKRKAKRQAARPSP
jgi:hypothetical protein